MTLTASVPFPIGPPNISSNFVTNIEQSLDNKFNYFNNFMQNLDDEYLTKQNFNGKILKNRTIIQNIFDNIHEIIPTNYNKSISIFHKKCFRMW